MEPLLSFFLLSVHYFYECIYVQQRVTNVTVGYLVVLCNAPFLNIELNVRSQDEPHHVFSYTRAMAACRST